MHSLEATKNADTISSTIAAGSGLLLDKNVKMRLSCIGGGSAGCVQRAAGCRSDSTSCYFETGRGISAVDIEMSRAEENPVARLALTSEGKGGVKDLQ